MKTLIAGLAAAIALAALVSGPALLAEEKKEKPAAADFSLLDLAGDTVTLSSFRGKVVMVNFWSVECPPCKAEIPSMNVLHEKMKGKPFVILALTTDSRQSIEDSIQKFKIQFTVLPDPKGEVTKAYGVYNVPATFLVGKDGKVENKILGPANWGDQSAVDYIQRLIDQ